MEAAVKTWTEEELMRLPHEGFKCELVEGELRMAPTGFGHEDLISALTVRLRPPVVKHRLGTVCGSNLGCWMKSGNLLCPDLSFISAARVPRTDAAREKYFQGAPDLVIEVNSPWDRDSRLREKMADYFASGARLAWVFDTPRRTVLVYRGTDNARSLRVTDTLDGEDVLPGFRLPLAELFAELSVE